jgi:hypothetical protein
MWVDSDLGRGATFFFSLPVYVTQKEPTPTTEKPVAVAAPLPWWKKLLGLNK